MPSADEVATVQGALDELGKASSREVRSIWKGFTQSLRSLVRRAFSEQWQKIVNVPRYANVAPVIVGLVGSQAASSELSVTTVGKALDAASTAAQRSVQVVWADLAGPDGDVPMKELLSKMTQIIENAHGSVTVLGSDVFKAQAQNLGITPKIVASPNPPASQIESVVGWATSTDKKMENLQGATDRIVKQAYRDVVQNSAIASGAGWARVPSGAKTCAFCLILASRGGVYRSKYAAEFIDQYGHKYHAGCDCVPVLVRSAKDYPEGYDPDAMYKMYSKAASSVKSSDIHDITGALRRMYPDNLSDGVTSDQPMSRDTAAPGRSRRPANQGKGNTSSGRQSSKHDLSDIDRIKLQLSITEGLKDSDWKTKRMASLRAQLDELTSAA